MSELGDRLRKARINSGLSQQEAATITGIKYKTINDYENGKSRPDVEKLALLCNAYNTPADYFINVTINRQKSNFNSLNEAEQKHLQNYRDLDNYGRDIVDAVLALELKRLEDFRRQLDQPKHQSPSSPHPKVKLPLFTLPASAGRGVALDTDVDFETIAVEDKSASREASFAIKVSGDSMEPEYFNGDVLLVKNDTNVDEGDLGIFVLNGEGYFKELGRNRLISYNDKYDDIIITADDSFYVKGRVLGKA